MYGKIFKSMFDGSLVASGWEAIITFMVLIVFADKDGEVDMTPQALSNRTTIPLEIIERGLAALMEPDPHSRSDENDGRRIELSAPPRPWGWRVINYEVYSKAINREALKAHWRKQYHDQKKKAS
ncbi:MAG: hypothetical protein AMS21_02040 [Gemmatimonas sp. SG8_38_2]|jgi:hypothetical protein|nr:MAG: hypothetical protein AMS21_02040 [Gemmatimonas sp. SG8_38_2]